MSSSREKVSRHFLASCGGRSAVLKSRKKEDEKRKENRLPCHTCIHTSTHKNTYNVGFSHHHRALEYFSEKWRICDVHNSDDCCKEMYCPMSTLYIACGWWFQSYISHSGPIIRGSANYLFEIRSDFCVATSAGRRCVVTASLKMNPHFTYVLKGQCATLY